MTSLPRVEAVRTWDFLSTNRFPSRSLSVSTGVAFPSHESIEPIFIERYTAEDFQRYVKSPLGRYTRKKGNHIYGVQQSESLSFVRRADIVDGWMRYPERWESSIEPNVNRYGKPYRSVSLNLNLKSEQLDTALFLWGSQDDVTVPSGIQNAIRLELAGHRDYWLRVVERTGITSLDYYLAVEDIEPYFHYVSEKIIDAFERPFEELFESVISVRDGAKNPTLETTKWAFAMLNSLAPGTEFDYEVPSIRPLIDAGVSPRRFQELYKAGVSLDIIPYVDLESIDIETAIAASGNTSLSLSRFA